MQNGDTPLLLASRNGHHGMVEVLLAHKADVNAKNNVSRGKGCAYGALGCHDWVSRFAVKVLSWPNDNE